MKKSKLSKGIKIGIIAAASLIVVAILMHLTINNLIPFITSIHNQGAAY